MIFLFSYIGPIIASILFIGAIGLFSYILFECHLRNVRRICEKYSQQRNENGNASSNGETVQETISEDSFASEDEADGNAVSRQPAPTYENIRENGYQNQSDSISKKYCKLTPTDSAYPLFRAVENAVSQKNRKDKISKKIFKGMNRLKDHPTVADNIKILQDPWYRRNRSKIYLYLVPLIALYYFIPSIQFVFLAKENEETTGSKDICYHNFKCQKPFWIFSDFNHTISNISYMILGLGFMVIVKIKAASLPKEHDTKTDHKPTYPGLLQQLSIFYSMGFCLFAQGCFSIVYHVCPTNLSLQYDTTMMYVISILCFVKLYQFRHPDASANAYSTMMILGKEFKSDSF